MKKFPGLVLMVFFTSSSFSQYIHYSDPGIIKKSQVSEVAKDELSFATVDCPGQSASLPVLTNYVPAEIVTKFKIKFNDRVYSITTLKAAEDKSQYKLKVCIKGQFKILLIDEDGKLVTK